MATPNIGTVFNDFAEQGQTFADSHVFFDRGWTRVDSAGAGAAAANAAWLQGGDVWGKRGDLVSVYNNGSDTSDYLHGLMFPLSDAAAGGSVAVGDAFSARVDMLAQAVNYAVGGIILSDGTTHGSGIQIGPTVVQTGTGTTINQGVFANWTTWDATQVMTNLTSRSAFIVRIVMTASNGWRADVSPDGLSWVKGSTYTKTFTPTHVGYFSSSWGSTKAHVITYSPIRRASGVS